MHTRATPLLLGVLLAVSVRTAPGAPLIAGHLAADSFAAIPAPYFQTVRDHYRFFYGHTSHGSQICTGLDMLAAEDPALYADVTMNEYASDLGTWGGLAWVAPTRSYLGAHPECNAVLWSWCDGATSNTLEGIDAYLNAMNQLEADYPGVLFVYMTGHLDGTGPQGTLYQNNSRIRSWCVSRGKTLFDFADIESWNPDGVYFPDETAACGWCSMWSATHACPSCVECAHSHCFNCYRKGQAFWWMMARASGWQPIGGVDSTETRLDRPPHPNPFARGTTLEFSLPAAGAVQLHIVDIAGRRVATLVDEPLSAGPHEFSWSGRTADGERAPAGVYFARLRGPGTARTDRLVLVP